MDKKSFFRGFGVGVLFAALILGVSFLVRTSDSYVKSRARELGMVYAGNQDSDKVLSDKGGATATPKTEDNSEQATSNPDTTKVPEVTKVPEKSSTLAPKATTSATSKPKSSSTKSSDNKDAMEKEKKQMEESMRAEEKKLTISAGEWSSDVSKKLASMGIVKNATDFDKYLEKNGYSDSISAGTYTVSKGDSYQELAKKITGR